ncbi:MAG: hypothetical protein M0Q95_15685 [Porticoccaceae bacterium]|nr:hypothetical protein [Porticoccaceae bacterium]
MPFKKPPTKAEIRAQLRAEIRAYLENGGKVAQIERGISGRDDNLPLRKVFFDAPKESRTYVTELVASVDARRKPAATKAPTPKAKKPRLKTLYDDFGEPLRKIWVED